MALGDLSAEPLLPIYNRRIPCICQHKSGLHGCVSKHRTRLASATCVEGDWKALEQKLPLTTRITPGAPLRCAGAGQKAWAAGDHTRSRVMGGGGWGAGHQPFGFGVARSYGVGPFRCWCPGPCEEPRLATSLVRRAEPPHSLMPPAYCTKLLPRAGAGGGGVREDGLGALSGGDGLGECPTPDRHVAQQIQSVGGPYRRPPRAGLGAT